MKMRQEITLCKVVLPLLTELIQAGRVSVRLGPLEDVRQWLNNHGSRRKKKMLRTPAASVSMELNRLHIDLRLDD